MNISQLRKRFVGDRAFYRMVLAVAVPIVVQNAITNFVGLLDNIMVGRVGTEQMSGVSIVNQLIFVYNLCIFGGLAGAGIFTAQYFGRGDIEGVRHTFRYKLWLAVILTVAAVAVLLAFGDRLISLYLSGESGGSDPAATLDWGLRYMRVCLLGLPAFMILQVYASTLRECGETRLPMKAGIAAVLVNLVFNWLLIYGRLGFPKLGVVGAGAATVLSRYVEAAIVVTWTHRHKADAPFAAGLYRTLKVPLRLVKPFFVKGFPLLVNEALWSSGMAVLNQCYSVRGLGVVAAMNISGTLLNLFSTVYMSMGSSVSIIVGQRLGAGRMEEARDTDYKMIAFSIFMSACFAILVLPFAPLFPRIYNTTDSIRALAARLVMVTALFMPQMAFMNAAYFTLRSGGKTVITFLFDSANLWAVSIPIAFLLSRCTTVDVVWIYAAVQIGDWIKCILGFILVKRGSWLQNIVA